MTDFVSALLATILALLIFATLILGRNRLRRAHAVHRENQRARTGQRFFARWEDLKNGGGSASRSINEDEDAKAGAKGRDVEAGTGTGGRELPPPPYSAYPPATQLLAAPEPVHRVGKARAAQNPFAEPFADPTEPRAETSASRSWYRPRTRQLPASLKDDAGVYCYEDMERGRCADGICIGKGSGGVVPYTGGTSTRHLPSPRPRQVVHVSQMRRARRQAREEARVTEMVMAMDVRPVPTLDPPMAFPASASMGDARGSVYRYQPRDGWGERRQNANLAF